MMKAIIRMACGILVLAIAPAASFAQDGTTPFLMIPETLARGQSEIGGYVSIEENIDLFGIYRRGLSPGFDVGLRLGFTDAAGGGVNFGGDARYMISHGSQDLPLQFALVGDAQFSILDGVNLFAAPAGVSMGAMLEPEDHPLWLYGTPYVMFTWVDVDGVGSDTDLDIGIELGAQLLLGGKLWLATALTIQNDVALALGLSYR
jgi:hypothetical protein